MTKHFRTLADLGAEGLNTVLARSAELKALRGRPDHPRPLDGKTVAVLLEKASTRTRISFEVGIHELGGLPLTLVARDTQLGRGEPLEDTARMLSRYVHAVVYRTFGHYKIEALAATSTIPVVNGLSDRYHPCQLLADLLTVREAHGALAGVPVAWVGDGNNMAHSWILAAALVGLDLRVATPPGFAPEPEVLELAAGLGGPPVVLTDDPREAVAGARVVTTDVWASMGQEEEAARRLEAFGQRYLVDASLMADAADDAIFLHCLPAHRGEEVAAEVIDGPASRVWDEAENRLHTQKALLEHLLA